MRFIISFIVIAVSVFSLTWYLNYDYNLFEYRLIEAIATYIYNYSNQRISTVENVNQPEIELPKCASWESLEMLVNDTTKSLDHFMSTTVKSDESLVSCLKMDLYFVNMTINDFETRVRQAADSVPQYLDLIRTVFLSINSGLEKMNDEIIGTSQHLLRIIDREQLSSMQKCDKEMRKTIVRLMGAIPNLDNSQLMCSCDAAVRLQNDFNEIISSANSCVLKTEIEFRSTYNETTSYLNDMLNELSAIVTMSREKPISFIDNLFYIPIQVCIWTLFNRNSLFCCIKRITFFIAVDKLESLLRSIESWNGRRSVQRNYFIHGMPIGLAESSSKSNWRFEWPNKWLRHSAIVKVVRTWDTEHYYQCDINIFIDLTMTKWKKKEILF